MSRRSSLEAIRAEIHDFTEGQNSRSKIRSNRRSITLTLPIALFLAIIISMGGWLWLLGGGILWLVFKVLFDDDWTASTWWRREQSIGSHSKRYRRPTSEGSKQMRRAVFKVVFLAAAIISMGGWIWLLGVGIRWLVVKL
jgi:hypothetical protein